VRVLVVLLALWAGLAGPAAAAEWATIVPASSTMEHVRAYFGSPTRSEAQKVESYDTTRWVYEGVQAPTGMVRMIVDFGLLQVGGFKRDVVRSFRLDPRPNIFTRDTIITGWGKPDGVSKEGGTDSYLYDEGLIVVFDKESWSAVSLVFTPPQPAAQARPSR
jgi:hypothetical protein